MDMKYFCVLLQYFSKMTEDFFFYNHCFYSLRFFKAVGLAFAVVEFQELVSQEDLI